MRKLLVIAAVIVVVLVIALAILVSRLDTIVERNRPWIEQQLEASLGRSVSFDTIGVSFRGGLGVRLTDLRIGDDPQFSDGDFARAPEVRLVAELVPLLFGEYEIREIILQRPVIWLIRTAAGVNVETLGRGAPGATASATRMLIGVRRTSVFPFPPAAHAQSTDLQIAVIQIRRGTMHYADRSGQTDRELTVKSIDAELSGLGTGDKVAVDVKASMAGADEHDLFVTGTTGPLPSGQPIETTTVDLEIRAEQLRIDELKSFPVLAESIPPKLSSPGPVRLNADLQGTIGELSIHAVLHADETEIRYGEAFVKPAAVPLRADVEGNRTAERIELESVALRLADLDARAAGTITTAKPALLDLRVDIPETPIATLLRLSPTLASTQASGTMAASLRFQGPASAEAGLIPTGEVALRDVSIAREGNGLAIADLTTTLTLRPDAIVLPPTQMRAGGAPVELEGRIEDLQSPRGHFTLRSEELRPAALGIDAPEEDVLRAVTVEAELRNAPEALVVATLQSGAGQLREIAYRGLEARVRTRPGESLHVEHLGIGAYGGTMTAEVAGNLYEENAPIQVTSTLREVDIGALLAARSRQRVALEGRMYGTLRLDGTRTVWTETPEQLQGNGHVEIRNGVVRDVNIAERLFGNLTGIAGLTQLISPGLRERYPGLFSTGDTRFETLSSDIRIADGQIYADDLTIQTDQFAAVGSGSVSFDQQVAFTGTFQLAAPVTEQLAAETPALRLLRDRSGRLEIPFQATGTLPGIRVRPDADFVRRALGRAIGGEILDRLLGQ